LPLPSERQNSERNDWLLAPSEQSMLADSSRLQAVQALEPTIGGYIITDNAA
jgi:hypothetical protein